MHDKEAIEMMRRASAEIKGLRREIDDLRPRAEAYDVLRAVIGLLPRPSQSYGEDLAWVLDKRVRELEEARAPAQHAAADRRDASAPAEAVA